MHSKSVEMVQFLNDIHKMQQKIPTQILNCDDYFTFTSPYFKTLNLKVQQEKNSRKAHGSKLYKNVSYALDYAFVDIRKSLL